MFLLRFIYAIHFTCYIYYYIPIISQHSHLFTSGASWSCRTDIVGENKCCFRKKKLFLKISTKRGFLTKIKHFLQNCTFLAKSSPPSNYPSLWKIRRTPWDKRETSWNLSFIRTSKQSISNVAYTVTSSLNDSPFLAKNFCSFYLGKYHTKYVYKGIYLSIHLSACIRF